MYGIFEVDLRQQTEKCLVGVVSNPDGGCCTSCSKPLAARIDGYCFGCALKHGVNVKQPGMLVSPSSQPARS